jgi:uncharacterized protein
VTKLFFATDVHGSEICWQKFINAGKFYLADIIILGGDMTGKAVVPLVDEGNHTYRVTFLEHESYLQDDYQVQSMIRNIKSRGYYPYLTNKDEMAELNAFPEGVHHIFTRLVLETAERWLSYADTKLAGTNIRCFVSPGNDDMMELDELILTSKFVQLVEGKCVDLDGRHAMVSSGWSNPTPWHTYREETEDKLLDRYEAMLKDLEKPENAVFNLHAPPYNSGLDLAPELTDDLRSKYAGNSLVPVGSRAARSVVEKYQPLLGLFGHIHESKGTARIGRTLCINPGSMYEQGCLLGALVNLDDRKMKDYILTNG